MLDEFPATRLTRRPGGGQNRPARKARKVGEALGVKVATDGASLEVLHALGIPLDWAERCEDAAHVGHDGTNVALALRLDWLRANQFSNFLEKVTQLGSYGGGNHFGECEVVRITDNDRTRGTSPPSASPTFFLRRRIEFIGDGTVIAWQGARLQNLFRIEASTMPRVTDGRSS